MTEIINIKSNIIKVIVMFIYTLAALFMFGMKSMSSTTLQNNCLDWKVSIQFAIMQMVNLENDNYT